MQTHGVRLVLGAALLTLIGVTSATCSNGFDNQFCGCPCVGCVASSHNFNAPP